jgi:hypothetical protein
MMIEIRIDSFAATIADATKGKTLPAADRVGSDLFGIGEHAFA